MCHDAELPTQELVAMSAHSLLQPQFMQLSYLHEWGCRKAMQSFESGRTKHMPVLHMTRMVYKGVQHTMDSHPRLMSEDVFGAICMLQT